MVLHSRMAPVKVDIWSDFVCPFCYLGWRKLQAAIEQSGLEVDLEWHSYELNQTAPPCYEGTLPEFLAEIMGGEPVERVEASLDILSEKMKEWGIEYNWKDAKNGNTFNAHRMSKLAFEKGLGKEYRERMYKAVHIDGLPIGEKEVLRKLSIEVGLSEKEVDEVLDGIVYAQEVRADEYDGIERQIQAVPHYVFSNNIVISGAASKERFLAALLGRDCNGEGTEWQPTPNCSANLHNTGG